MTTGNVEIERIVREVIRRLSDTPPRDQAGDRVMVTASPVKPRADRSEPVFRQRVISLAVLQGRVDACRRVRIPRGAILTPSAHDELRKRGIQIEYLTALGESQPTTEMTELFVATWQTTHCPRAFLDAVGVDGQHVTKLDLSDGPQTLVQTLADAAPESHRLGVLLTDEPSLAVCLTNRPPNVRAAWGMDARSVVEAVSSLAANLLVVQPGRHSLSAMINMTRTFLASGGGPCPETVKRGHSVGV